MPRCAGCPRQIQFSTPAYRLPEDGEELYCVNCMRADPGRPWERVAVDHVIPPRAATPPRGSRHDSADYIGLKKK